jgi:hypothetical protein
MLPEDDPILSFNPVFLCGHRRSGTTLLRSLLDRHPGMAMLNELFFFNRIGATGHPGRLDHRQWRDRWRGILSLEGQIPADSFYDAFCRLKPTPAHLLMAALKQHAAAKGKQRCGEKSPINLSYARKILAWYPASKIVILLRDPRGVVSSVRRSPAGWGKDNLHEAAVWSGNAWHALKLARRYPDRIRLVRYEALVQDPAGVLSGLGGWLGLPLHPAQLDPSIPTGAFESQDQPWMALASKPVQKEREEAWRRELDPASQALVETVARRAMARLGYAPCQPPLPLPRRLAVLVRASLHYAAFHPLWRERMRLVKQALQRRRIRIDFFSR